MTELNYMYFQKHRSNDSQSRASSRRSSYRGNRGIPHVHPSVYVHKAEEMAPEPVNTVHSHFCDFPIEERVQKNIASHGYDVPTPIQDKTILPILEGKDIVGIANTGTGKTAAFLIPIISQILKDPTKKVIILAPTRELAVQINDEVRAFTQGTAIRAVLVIGGADSRNQMYALHHNPNIVIGTPGRLKDLANRNALNMNNFHTVVLDEVDRMVDIGFIKDISYILGMLPKDRQSLFFSATVSPDITGIIQRFAINPVMISVKTQETARTIDQDVIRVTSNNDKVAKLSIMLKSEEYRKVLIFGRTKWNVKKLAQLLSEQGFAVDSLHGNKSQSQRMRALAQFRQNRIQVLVATDVASRGLDVDDITHVINFDEPSTREDYVHRIGRTGRAEKQGKAITFVI